MQKYLSNKNKIFNIYLQYNLFGSIINRNIKSSKNMNNILISFLSKKQFSLSTNIKKHFSNNDNCPLRSILIKKNFYDIFQMEENYIIDKKILEKKYKDIQMIIHPDKFAQLDKIKLDEAHNASSLVITAFNTLKDDYQRGNYLLELKGFESIKESNTIHDKEFLIEFMEKQERIDDCESKEEIIIIKNEIHDDIYFLTNKLTDLFNKKDYKECVNILNTIKFNLSLIDNINNKI
jgi:molecular chaperone HscB